MAYRMCQVAEVKYGQFGAAMKVWRELIEIMRDRGWVVPRVIAPTVGPNNQMIVEFEYPDLAALERENKAFYADAEAFEKFRSGAQYVVEGSARTELYEDVPLDVFAG